MEKHCFCFDASLHSILVTHRATCFKYNPSYLLPPRAVCATQARLAYSKESGCKQVPRHLTWTWNGGWLAVSWCWQFYGEGEARATRINWLQIIGFFFFLITRRCPFKISTDKPIDSHGKSWSFFIGTFFLVVLLFTTYSKYSSIELHVKLSTHSDARRPILTNIANKRLLCKSLHCVWLEKQKTIALKSLQATYRSKGKYISGLGGGAREWEWPMWCIICS
jgi:hypothetical protein